MNSWKRIEPTKVSEHNFKPIIEKSFLLPNGKTYVAETVNPEKILAACVVALTTEDKVIIAYQYRPGPERMMYEIPGGVVDEGEQPLDAAKRELLEETGFSSDSWEILGTASLGPYDNLTHHYFFARDCVQNSNQHLDDNEFIEVKLISIDEFINRAIAGEMTDADAVLKAYEILKEIQYGTKSS